MEMVQINSCFLVPLIGGSGRWSINVQLAVLYHLYTTYNILPIGWFYIYIYTSPIPPIMETRFHSIDQNIVSGFREACGGKMMFSATMKVKVTRCCSSNLPIGRFSGRSSVGWLVQLDCPETTNHRFSWKKISIYPPWNWHSDIFAPEKNGWEWNTIVWFSYIGIPPIFRCELLVSG